MRTRFLWKSCVVSPSSPLCDGNVMVTLASSTYASGCCGLYFGGWIRRPLLCSRDRCFSFFGLVIGLPPLEVTTTLDHVWGQGPAGPRPTFDHRIPLYILLQTSFLSCCNSLADLDMSGACLLPSARFASPMCTVDWESVGVQKNHQNHQKKTSSQRDYSISTNVLPWWQSWNGRFCRRCKVAEAVDVLGRRWK